MGRGQATKSAPGALRRQTPGRCVGRAQWVTAKGLALDLVFRRQILDGDPAWDVDLIEARYRGRPSGYLKLAFISPEQLTAQYPTAFEYTVRKLGKYLGVRDLLDVPEEQWSQEDLVAALKSTDDFPYPSSEQLAARESESEASLRETWAARKAAVAETHQAHWEAMRAFHVSRPVVDYIAVNGPGQFTVIDGIDGDGRARRVEPDFEVEDMRRRGVGSALYEAGALWAAQRGMELHASTLQEEEAELAWRAFEARGVVRPAAGDSGRRVLDVDALVAERPDLAGALAAVGS